jgi:uncharacterized protein (UPF0332 family)
MVKAGTPPQHLAKAIELVRATRALLLAGMPERAAAESYYAVFHLAQALLATAGVSAETHAGVHTLLARHFVKDGPLDGGFSRRFSHLMGDRLNADYGVDRQIDAAGGREAVRLAVTLLREALTPLPSLAPEHAGVAVELAVETEALAAALGD